MKILVIANLYPSKNDPTYGTFVKNFVDGLTDREKIQKIDLCVIRGRSKNWMHKLFKYLCFFSTAFYYLVFKKYDIVYNHLTHGALPLRLVSKFKSLPLVFNLHGEDLLAKTKISKYCLKLIRPLFKDAKLIVVPSHFFKRKVMEMIPEVDSSLIYVSASGGIASNFFYNNDKPSAKVTFTIGYVSRIDRGKGWDLFIDAVCYLNNQGINVTGALAGNGFQIQQMQDCISAKGANNYIKYIGPIPYKELPAFYSKLDLFIFPTQLEESLGLVGLEAMACMVPIVATQIGGITDYVKEGVNGYYFAKGDISSLVNSIKRYFDLPQEAKEAMQQAAYETAKNYDAKVIMDRMYDKLLTLV